MAKEIQIPKKQRALVLQGGGALGAYEAGAFRAIYDHFTKENDETNRPLFDIVAGTSSGAINAAILVSYVMKKQTWSGSAEHLEKFWHHLSSTPNLANWWPFSMDDNSWVSTWQERHHINQNAATGEVARRYYSAKEFLYSGAPNVFSKPNIGYDNKFFDEFSPPVNLWYKYDNQPLKKSISNFVTEPIATGYSEVDYKQSSSDYNTSFKQPRLLLVSVDIEEGTSVVFDSYSKEKNVDKRYSSYQSDVIGDDKKNNTEKVIRYDKGITVDHIIASASVPINYDYTTLEVENNFRNTNVNNNTSNNKHKGYFWDGGLLSNSPLRELIQSHRDYWLMMNDISNIDNGSKEIKNTNRNYEEQELKKTPDLDLYIVDVHPSKNYDISYDRDGVLNRNTDITFHNRNSYDLKVANIISDYVDLAKLLIRKAKEHGLREDIINKALNESTNKSKSRSGESRKYMDLLEGRFKIDKVKHFERKNDKNAISNKAFDFSTRTINQLMYDGYNETKAHLR
jgi:NTE family protein